MAICSIWRALRTASRPTTAMGGCRVVCAGAGRSPGWRRRLSRKADRLRRRIERYLYWLDSGRARCCGRRGAVGHSKKKKKTSLACDPLGEWVTCRGSQWPGSCGWTGADPRPLPARLCHIKPNVRRQPKGSEGASPPCRRRALHEEPWQTTDVPFVEPALRTHGSLFTIPADW